MRVGLQDNRKGLARTGNEIYICFRLNIRNGKSPRFFVKACSLAALDKIALVKNNLKGNV